MRCVMTNGLYLRADGRLPCYCGAGETVTLNRFEPGKGIDFVEDVFTKGMFAHIRESQSKELVPFPGVCDQCSYLEPDEPFDDAEKLLRWFHWEPTTKCMLDCEWCGGQRDGSSKLLNMDMALFTDIVDSFARAGYRLDKGNICGVGEPTINSDHWAMVKYAKDRLGGDILVSTNGNGQYSDDIVPSGIDKIKIAIDSTEQDQYVRYRKNGRIDRVYDFTRRIAEAREAAGSESPRLIWQYIMFNYNDSDQELLNLQNLANEMGVDALRIVYTRCNNFSSKKVEDFPVAFDDIDFFQIKQESLLTVGSATERFELAAESGASAYISLINDVYKRLLLGVETYKDLLASVYDLEPLIAGGTLSLTEEEARAMQQLVVQSLAALADIYDLQGQSEQAGKYRRFMSKAGMVQS